jgi:hypothetical protein
MNDNYYDSAMRPILLVGAGRSGTNLIAFALDASTKLSNVYEQRYVWTKGSRLLASDVRTSDEATRSVRDYIRNHFARQGAAAGPSVRLVDKTPANALRIEFCLSVFPEAQVINVVRNPFDNIASRIVELQKIGQDTEGGEGTADGRVAVLRRRILHARDLISRGNITLDRLPIAFADQVLESIRIVATGQAARYAERVPGLSETVATQGNVAALCHQWRELVMTATRVGRVLGADRYLEVYYEDVVHSPAEVGRKMAQFIGLSDSQQVIDRLVAEARPESVGRASYRITADQYAEIKSRLASEIAFFGRWESPG